MYKNLFLLRWEWFQRSAVNHQSFSIKSSCRLWLTLITKKIEAVNRNYCWYDLIACFANWKGHYLELVKAFSEGRHLVLSVAPHQLAQSTDELVVHQAIHVDLLILMLQAGQAADVGVWHRLHQAVAGEWLFIRVSCAKTTVTVWDLTCDTCLDSLTRRILLTELAADAWIHFSNNTWAVVSVGVVDVIGVVGVRVGVAGSGRAAAGAASTCATTAANCSSYCTANGGGVGPLRLQTPAFSGGVGAAKGGLLEAVNDVLQRHIALKALQAAVIQCDDVTTGRALKGWYGLEGLAGGAVRYQDAVGTIKTQAVGTGQEKGIFKQLQADRAGQLRLQCFHLQLNQSKGDIKSHGSWPVTCMKKKKLRMTVAVPN